MNRKEKIGDKIVKSGGLYHCPYCHSSVRLMSNIFNSAYGVGCLDCGSMGSNQRDKKAAKNSWNNVIGKYWEWIKLTLEGRNE